MAARQTVGQQLLPGDPEALLRVSRDRMRKDSDVFAYLAVSVTRSRDGGLALRSIRMDPTTRRVVPHLLEEIPAGDAEAYSLEQAVFRAARLLALAVDFDSL